MISTFVNFSNALLIGVPYVPRTQRPDLSALAQKQLTSIPPFSKGIFSNTDLMKFSHHSIFTFFISLTAFHVFLFSFDDYIMSYSYKYINIQNIQIVRIYIVKYVYLYEYVKGSIINYERMVKKWQPAKHKSRQH